ncbi:MAG: STAS domain-containing protein [Phycisphaerales bacterium]|nr:STAS domain-containing protein [Phycisphaerales bacterium]
MNVQVNSIDVGSRDNGLYIRVNGRATQRTAPTANKIVSDFLAAHATGASITIDLYGADFIDSTFAGWMISARRRTLKQHGRLVLVGCGERCLTSLAKMQLSTLFEYAPESPAPALRAIQCQTGDRPDKAALELMLAAHQELAAVSEQNAEVFGPIADILKRQLAAG